jgi:hypothetical protein
VEHHGRPCTGTTGNHRVGRIGREDLHRWERRHGIARADAAATLLDVVADHTLARTAINVFGG